MIDGTPIQFLLYIFRDSVPDIAAILNAQADDDRETIVKYLMRVQNFTIKLINEINEQTEQRGTDSH